MERERISGPGVGRDGGIVAAMDTAHVQLGRVQRDLLRAVLECDRHDSWQGHGARSLAEFLAGRYGIAQWKARRWIGAAYALEHLPLTSHALVSGTLCLDKVVELTRFATPATEKKLIRWARRVTSGGIRARADAEIRVALETVQGEESSCSLEWWWHGDESGLQFGGRLPAADGALFIAAIDRLAKDVPADPPSDTTAGTTEADNLDRRRADALVQLCSAHVANEQGSDRAMVVVHAPLESLTRQQGNGTIAGGPPIHPTTVQRLACDSRLEVTLYGDDGRVVGVGRSSRELPAWLRRQVLRRDSHTCTFPGCEMKRFLRTHHIEWWSHGGPTNLENLITVCHTHHKLVHEQRWSVSLQGDSEPAWFYPSGRRFEPGPAPPESLSLERIQPQPESDDVAPWPAFWHMLAGEEGVVFDDASTRHLLRLGARMRSDRFGDQAQDVVHHLFGRGPAHETDADRAALSRG